MHLNAPKLQQRTTATQWYCTLHSTFNHKTQTNIISPKNFLEILQLNANGIHNKTDEVQLLIKNTRADIITIQETKLNQSHKTSNIPQFTPIRTDHTHRQGRGLPTYIKNISFSQLNLSNTFPIELQIIKIHLSTSQQLHIANMCIPPSYHKQKTQLYPAHLQP